MRLNQYIALSTGLSRRAADDVIAAGSVTVNGEPAQLGARVSETDVVTMNRQAIQPPSAPVTIMINKPVGYVCSRDGQGSETVYDLLPAEYHHLKPVGRLDKDSSGLLLLTNDGSLAHELTHPSFKKEKQYEVTLNKNLPASDKKQIEDGLKLDDGPSSLQLEGDDKSWKVTMSEGRNRQIRRTFEALGYHVVDLHRTKFGEYTLGDLETGKLQVASSAK